MGRGRQKAKHTKVARDLKYFSPDTNYGALAAELSSGDRIVAAIDPERLEEDLAAWPEYVAGSYSADEEDDEDESRSA